VIASERKDLLVASCPHLLGNLPTEKVTKRDLFRIFHKHGRLAQISIKQAYGFVQFLDQSSCASALRHEQGSSVRGRKMRKTAQSNPIQSNPIQSNPIPVARLPAMVA